MVEIGDSEKFDCIVCYNIAHDAFSCLKCGTILCKECKNHVRECPVCREGHKRKIHPNLFARQTIKIMVINCSKGCGFKTTRETLPQHEQNCNGPQPQIEQVEPIIDWRLIQSDCKEEVLLPQDDPQQIAQQEALQIKSQNEPLEEFKDDRQSRKREIKQQDKADFLLAQQLQKDDYEIQRKQVKQLNKKDKQESEERLRQIQLESRRQMKQDKDFKEFPLKTYLLHIQEILSGHEQQFIENGFRQLPLENQKRLSDFQRFNQEPVDGQQDRKFIKWKSGLYGSLLISGIYQGSVNSKDERDGKGIIIWPDDRIDFGWFKKNQWHGKVSSIYPDGKLTEANYENHKQSSFMTTISPGGQVFSNSLPPADQFLGTLAKQIFDSLNKK